MGIIPCNSPPFPLFLCVRLPLCVSPLRAPSLPSGMGPRVGFTPLKAILYTAKAFLYTPQKHVCKDFSAV